MRTEWLRFPGLAFTRFCFVLFTLAVNHKMSGPGKLDSLQERGFEFCSSTTPGPWKGEWGEEEKRRYSAGALLVFYKNRANHLIPTLTTSCRSLLQRLWSILLTLKKFTFSPSTLEGPVLTNFTRVQEGSRGEPRFLCAHIDMYKVLRKPVRSGVSSLIKGFREWNEIESLWKDTYRLEETASQSVSQFRSSSKRHNKGWKSTHDSV